MATSSATVTMHEMEPPLKCKVILHMVSVTIPQGKKIESTCHQTAGGWCQTLRLCNLRIVSSDATHVTT
jgi:hypothetical protein